MSFDNGKYNMNTGCYYLTSVGCRVVSGINVLCVEAANNPFHLSQFTFVFCSGASVLMMDVIHNK